MADEDDTVVDAAPAAATPVARTAPAPRPAPADEGAAFHVTLEEFCRSQSAQPGASVELLAAFHNSEARGDRARDSVANFAERYAAFASKPV